MICPRCSAQYPDHSNFCFHCGLQVNPNMPPQPGAPFNPTMPPMGNSNMPGTDDVRETYIFRLGMIGFIVNMFWVLWNLMGYVIGMFTFYRFQGIMNFVAVITSSLVVLFAMIYSKKPNFKTTLIVFFVVSLVLGFLSKFLMSYMNPF